MNYSDIEQFWADAMPAYAARENAACAKHWDAKRLDDNLGRQGVRGGKVQRVDELVAIVAANGPITLDDIAAHMDLTDTTASNYISAALAAGRIERRRVNRLSLYSLKVKR